MKKSHTSNTGFNADLLEDTMSYNESTNPFQNNFSNTPGKDLNEERLKTGKRPRIYKPLYSARLR
jgi:hypothetical protein